MQAKHWTFLGLIGLAALGASACGCCDEGPGHQLPPPDEGVGPQPAIYKLIVEISSDVPARIFSDDGFDCSGDGDKTCEEPFSRDAPSIITLKAEHLAERTVDWVGVRCIGPDSMTNYNLGQWACTFERPSDADVRVQANINR